jgi:tetratricopeptide (TPR) repeat protein
LIRTLLAVPLSITLSLGLSVCAGAQEKGQLDGDPALFTMMAALNAAGLDTDIDSGTNHPLRQAVRDYLKTRKIGSLEELKRFFAAHKKDNPAADFSQYVSFALSVEGPPDFSFRYVPAELAPDVGPLEELPSLLAKFYREANIAVLWEKAQPEFEKVLNAYQPPVSRGLMQANAYLRNPTSGYLGRRFQVYIDLLGPPNQVHTRSYKDDYFIAVTPSAELQVDEIRHAYLHYLLDPLVMKFSEALHPTRALADYAQDAPALDEFYKSDYTLLATECLIKAVEARLLPGGKREEYVTQALREGFVMTPAFFDALGGYEKQEQALRLFFPEMVASIDLRKEERRLANIAFVRQRAVKTVKVVPAERKVELTPAQKALEEANALYAARKLEPAKVAFSRLLEMTTDRAVHGRAYYGLARIAALERDPETSERLFRRTLELSQDPEVRSWSLVYLGRLFDAQNDRDEAVESYRAVLAMEQAPSGARQAAEKGLKESFQRK